MVTCRYHPSVKAVSVFKCHIPKFVSTVGNDGLWRQNEIRNNANLAYAHSVNLFLCKECSASFSEDHPFRYIHIRQFVPISDMLPDNWTREWRQMYTANGVILFADPRGKVYEVEVP